MTYEQILLESVELNNTLMESYILEGTNSKYILDKIVRNAKLLLKKLYQEIMKVCDAIPSHFDNTLSKYYKDKTYLFTHYDDKDIINIGSIDISGYQIPPRICDILLQSKSLTTLLGFNEIERCKDPQKIDEYIAMTPEQLDLEINETAKNIYKNITGIDDNSITPTNLYNKLKEVLSKKTTITVDSEDILTYKDLNESSFLKEMIVFFNKRSLKTEFALDEIFIFNKAILQYRKKVRNGYIVSLKNIDRMYDQGLKNASDNKEFNLYKNRLRMENKLITATFSTNLAVLNCVSLIIRLLVLNTRIVFNTIKTRIAPSEQYR